jgi:hypothetical protein
MDLDRTALLWVFQWLNESGYTTAVKALEKDSGRLFEEDALKTASCLMNVSSGGHRTSSTGLGALSVHSAALWPVAGGRPADTWTSHSSSRLVSVGTARSSRAGCVQACGAGARGRGGGRGRGGAMAARTGGRSAVPQPPHVCTPSRQRRSLSPCVPCCSLCRPWSCCERPQRTTCARWLRRARRGQATSLGCGSCPPGRHRRPARGVRTPPPPSAP